MRSPGKAVFPFMCVLISTLVASLAIADSESDKLRAAVDQQAGAAESDVIAWRRHFHQHPELSNREFKTSKYIAAQLEELGLEVTTGIAHTGVVGILKGGLPGPVVAIRADMDGLPVTEALNLPFSSNATTTYNGQETGVMHACGHDAHMAIALGAAKVFAGVRDELPGTVMFVFQPAEEGAPTGEKGGAKLMLEEGLFDQTRPDAIFALHAWSPVSAGVIQSRSGPLWASYDNFQIVVKGRQTHASRPWQGIDPVVVASQIVLALQTIASRQVDVTMAPSVISIGSIHGGIRNNIIPDQVEMLGTVRAFDTGMRNDILERIEVTAGSIAESAGTEADVNISYGYPVTKNDPELAVGAMSLLEDVLGSQYVQRAPLTTGAEDFSYFAQEVPGFYFLLGVTPPDQNPATAPANHSPLFFIDESALMVGLRSMSHLTAAFLTGEL
ncbi:MAG: amidohydrolase [Gammaproteobacteria bacterium]